MHVHVQLIYMCVFLVPSPTFTVYVPLIITGAGIIACAPLIDVETITLNQPITDYLTVSQRGPYEETVVTIATPPSTAVSIQLSSHFLRCVCIQYNVVYILVGKATSLCSGKTCQ